MVHADEEFSRFSIFPFHGRMITIHDRINSLQFSNDVGDLLLGIGDHLYAMSHLSCRLHRAACNAHRCLPFRSTQAARLQNRRHAICRHRTRIERERSDGSNAIGPNAIRRFGSLTTRSQSRGHVRTRKEAVCSSI